MQTLISLAIISELAQIQFILNKNKFISDVTNMVVIGHGFDGIMI